MLQSLREFPYKEILEKLKLPTVKERREKEYLLMIFIALGDWNKQIEKICT